MSGAPGPSGHAPLEYEKRDVHIGGVLRAGTIVLAVSTLTALAVGAYMAGLERVHRRADPPPRARVFEGARQPPAPRLQEQPFEDLHALRAREDELLANYGWVDRAAGVVHLPIEEAMRLYAQRAAAPAAEPAGGGPGAAAPSGSAP